MTVRLTKTPTGYMTPDGRWTVTRLTGMGAGVTGWAGGRGWSDGKTGWEVRNVTEEHRLGIGGSRKVVDRLYEARDLIAAYEGTPA